MKEWVIFLFALISLNNFSQTNISPQFSELKGMEDQQGNTILFYRIFQDSTWNEYYFLRTNHVYKFNVETGADNFFLNDYNFETEEGMGHFNIYDIDFWESDPNKFIYCGHAGIFDSHTFVFRFDEPTINFFPGWIGSVNKIELSTNNDSLISLGCWANFAGVYIRTSKSTDGGYNWYTISDSLQLLAVKPDNEQMLFCYNDNGYIANYDGGLYKSTNGGANFYLVDTLKKYPSAEYDEIIFDANANNIFRLFETMYGDFELRISLNNGEPFSWQTKYSSDYEIFISIDESISGTIYLADKKNILVSTDYGDNFNLYKTLDRKIVGIYKKPNSNKLYAATKYKICEITPDSINIIKNLTIPEEVLNLYPLAVGNRWVYLTVSGVNPNIIYGVASNEVIGDSIAANGKLYYHLKDGDYHSLERVDTVDGKVYRFYEHPNLPESEYVIIDLISEVGDTLITFNPGSPGITSYLITTGIDSFYKWGLTRLRKNFIQSTYPVISNFEYGEDLGMNHYTWIMIGYSVYYERTLKGCIINGIIYGDTTLTEIDGDEIPIASEFKLEQNYPNPFNPSTVISYQLPVSGNVSLKVYDVLGNEIATLVNEEKPAGEYEVTFDSHSGEVRNLPSGIYFYTLKAGIYNQTRKMILLK